MNSLHRSIQALRCQFSDFVDRYHEQFFHLETLWISDTNSPTNQNIPYKQAFHKLGQEADLVIFDANNGVDVNALGAICGCIRGGGALILLLPSDDKPFDNSRFYKRLLRILTEHHIFVEPANSAPSISVTTTKKLHSNDTTPRIIATPGQQKTIQAVKKVVFGHRNRPLVITSDRGRGKSTAIGMAINELLHEKTLNIIVCAPAKATVTPLLLSAGKHPNLNYFAVDELLRELPEAGLVVIDEAGAVPVPALSKLLTHYSRLVFSTTLHGYEGNGRGFAVRFHHQLNQLTPQWRAIKLTDPIRWSGGDPLEALINDLLLLDAEPAALESLEDIKADELTYQRLTPEQLLKDESQLRQLFGLLVIAHYQTRPSDLLQMLDAPHLSIHGMFHSKKLIAAAIVSHEGELNSQLAEAVYQGRRRPKGHLVPQIIIAQMGISEASGLKTDRIMRIATHPSCRRKHIAFRLLDAIASTSTADYMSTSFGLSEELLSFWKQSEYSPVYLGLKREASSGYHSAVFLRPLSNRGTDLHNSATATFAMNLPALLGDKLRHYDPWIAYQLLTIAHQTTTSLCQQEIRDIKRFSEGQCSFESAIVALQRWLPTALIDDKQKINNKEAKLLIMRILQHHSWSHCSESLELSGKKLAQQALQKTVSVLASDLLSAELSKDGLTRR